MLIITANELISGASVYLLNGGGWGADIQKAQLFPKEGNACLLALEEARKSGQLISVESEIVSELDGKIRARRLRERIRANGPTAPRQRPQSFIPPSSFGEHHVSL